MALGQYLQSMVAVSIEVIGWNLLQMYSVVAVLAANCHSEQERCTGFKGKIAGPAAVEEG